MPLNINLPNIPNLPIAPAGLVHFAFTGLVLLYPWLPQYAFVHFGLLLLALWAAHDKQSALAVIMYQIGLFISFVIDIISIGYYFHFFNAQLQLSSLSLWQFSAAMAIIHLIIKPFMGVYALVIVLARRASLKISLSDLRPGGGSSDGYDSIGDGGEEGKK